MSFGIVSLAIFLVPGVVEPGRLIVIVPLFIALLASLYFIAATRALPLVLGGIVAGLGIVAAALYPFTEPADSATLTAIIPLTGGSIAAFAMVLIETRIRMLVLVVAELAGAEQHHVRRMLHHRSSQGDGTAYRGNTGHRSGAGIHEGKVDAERRSLAFVRERRRNFERNVPVAPASGVKASVLLNVCFPTSLPTFAPVVASAGHALDAQRPLARRWQAVFYVEARTDARLPSFERSRNPRTYSGPSGRPPSRSARVSAPNAVQTVESSKSCTHAYRSLAAYAVRTASDSWVRRSSAVAVLRYMAYGLTMLATNASSTANARRPGVLLRVTSHALPTPMTRHAAVTTAASSSEVVASRAVRSVATVSTHAPRPPCAVLTSR